jgi:hypothetical protein
VNAVIFCGFCLILFNNLWQDISLVKVRLEEARRELVSQTVEFEFANFFLLFHFFHDLFFVFMEL